MIAQLTYPDRQRAMNRQHAVSELLADVAGQAGLSPCLEQDVRSATMRLLDPILTAADGLVAAGVELEAMDGRIDRHIRTHLGCSLDVPCARVEGLKRDRARLQRVWDRRFRKLAGGPR